MPEGMPNRQSASTQSAGTPNASPPPDLATPEDRPRKRAGVRVLIWLAVLLAFGGLFWFVVRHQQAQPAAAANRSASGGAPVSLTVATAENGSIGVYLDAIGTVTPVYTDTITSQVTGLITAVHYTEGQLVKKGDSLIEVDSRPYTAQLLEAEGALERDTNLLAQAKMDEERYEKAWAGDGVARQTLEDQQKLVLQTEGTVKLDQGTVQYNQVQVAFCNITAPISGRVGLRLVDPGNVVQANSTTPLVVITQLQPITVVFTIAEDSVGQVQTQMRQGKTLEVTAYDRTNQAKISTGKLQTIDNQIDTTTGTLKLRAIFENKSNELFPNLFVNTKLLVKTLQGMTLIPSSAVQQNGDTSFVYVIQGGIAHLRNIKPGVSDSGNTAVEGINPGDVVATSSFEKLQDGVRVAVTQTPPASSNSGSNAP